MKRSSTQYLSKVTEEHIKNIVYKVLDEIWENDLEMDEWEMNEPKKRKLRETQDDLMELDDEFPLKRDEPFITANELYKKEQNKLIF